LTGRHCQALDAGCSWPMKSASPLRVVSLATRRKSGAIRKGQRREAAGPAEMEWLVAIHPMIAGDSAAGMPPKKLALP